MSLEDVKSRCVVRVRRTMWASERGAHLRTDITVLKRLSHGFNIFLNDLSEVGAEEVLQHFLNLDLCEDGVYELITCNKSRDFETGYIDSYDYRLIPYQQKVI